MQNALNITTPDSGILVDEMLLAVGATVPAGRFTQPRIEAEIALVMRSPLRGAGVTRADVLAATQHVAPGLEILDTRVQRMDPSTGKARSLFGTLADNAANAGIVPGAQRHATDAFDPRWVGAIVKRDGMAEETGVSAAVLNEPATGIFWLAHQPAMYEMGTLPATSCSRARSSARSRPRPAAISTPISAPLVASP